jgi:phospholipid/cholesterol/gamma-HCH transport system substrate-binding protein
MKRSVSIGWGRLWVGLLLLITFVMLMWVSLGGSKPSVFQPKRQFIAYFKHVGGLLPGSPIWMSGMEVGAVSSVRFVNLDTIRQVEVVSRVREAVWPMLTPGSRVQLGTVGFVGDKIVEILPGPPGVPPINAGDVLPTANPGDASSMFKAGEEAIRQGQSMIGSLDTMLMKTNRGEGSMGRLVNDSAFYVETVRLMRNLSALTLEMNKSQEKVVGSLTEITNSLKEITNEVQTGRGTVPRFLNDSSLYTNLDKATARLDSIMLRLDSQEGSLGMMVRDTGLYVETVNLLTRLNSLLKQIEENPGKYLNFSVF